MHNIVVAIELGGGSDERVLTAARRDGRILVTADTDFGDLLALSGEAQPGVVLLRRPGRRPEERTEAIRPAFESVGDRLESGALVAVEPHTGSEFVISVSRRAEWNGAQLSDSGCRNTIRPRPRHRLIR